MFLFLLGSGVASLGQDPLVTNVFSAVVPLSTGESVLRFYQNAHAAATESLETARFRVDRAAIIHSAIVLKNLADLPLRSRLTIRAGLVELNLLIAELNENPWMMSPRLFKRLPVFLSSSVLAVLRYATPTAYHRRSPGVIVREDFIYSFLKSPEYQVVRAALASGNPLVAPEFPKGEADAASSDLMIMAKSVPGSAELQQYVSLARVRFLINDLRMMVGGLTLMRIAVRTSRTLETADLVLFTALRCEYHRMITVFAKRLLEKIKTLFTERVITTLFTFRTQFCMMIEALYAPTERLTRAYALTLSEITEDARRSGPESDPRLQEILETLDGMTMLIEE